MRIIRKSFEIWIKDNHIRLAEDLDWDDVSFNYQNSVVQSLWMAYKAGVCWGAAL